MNRKYLLRRIAQDCIPTVFSLLMSGLYGVMDGLFVGRAVGDAGLAAINIAWPIAAVITAVGIGIGSGGSVLYSNSNGKGEQERGELVYHQTITLLFAAAMVLLIVLGFTYPAILSALGAKGDVYQKAVEYIQIIIFGAVFQVMGTGFIPMLRNRNLAFQAMVSMAAGMGVNGVLNYLLLFVVKIGIRGAAVGTIAAQFVVLVISSYLIYGRQKVHLKVVWQHKMIGEILKIGISAFGLSLAPSIVLLFTNLQCLKYGGDAAVACYAVISYIVFPVQSMLMGIGDGTQPLMSFYSGAKKMEELRFVKKIASIVVVGMGAVFFVIVILVSKYIPDVFGMQMDSQAYFGTGMAVSAVSFLFTGLAKFHISYLNATLQVKKAMQLIYGETIVVAPFLIFLLPYVFKINGIWLSLPGTQLIMLLIFNVFFTKTGK
ncbi:MATE efflux family protein [Coprococcus sp. AF18-48]|nr:MATE efflux family protein [Coprococcus sp. AF18-48]